MTLGNGGTKVSIPDNLVKIVVYTVAILGVGYKVAQKVNSFDNRAERIEQRLDVFIFDLCSHTPPHQRITYISCSANATTPSTLDGLQAQEPR